MMRLARSLGLLFQGCTRACMQSGTQRCMTCMHAYERTHVCMCTRMLCMRTQVVGVARRSGWGPAHTAHSYGWQGCHCCCLGGEALHTWQLTNSTLHLTAGAMMLQSHALDCHAVATTLIRQPPCWCWIPHLPAATRSCCGNRQVLVSDQPFAMKPFGSAMTPSPGPL